MNRGEVLATARLAGQVERYHTWPVHRHQSIGEHTWQVMRIWWQVFGPMDARVSSYLLWHDAGELRTGDPPFPLKATNPDIKERLDQLESEAVVSMGGPNIDAPAGLLTGIDRVRAKVCDLLEMYEFGRTEQCLGNAYAAPIVNDTGAYVTRLVKDLPLEDRQAVNAYMRGLDR